MKQTTINSLIAVLGLCAITAMFLKSAKNNGGTFVMNENGIMYCIPSCSHSDTPTA